MALRSIPGTESTIYKIVPCFLISKCISYHYLFLFISLSPSPLSYYPPPIFYTWKKARWQNSSPEVTVFFNISSSCGQVREMFPVYASRQPHEFTFHVPYVFCCAVLKLLSRVWLSVSPWTIALQDPLSMGILRARILEWVDMLSSRGSSQPRIECRSLPLQADSLLAELPEKPMYPVGTMITMMIILDT